jgi:hypothetical protein
MPSQCFTPIKAKVARVVKLDVCGNPVTGASSSVAVFDGFTQINPSPEYEEGEEFLTKKANGEPCVNQKDPNFLKRVGLDITFCNIDPDVIVMLTGERLITTGGPATGTGVAFGEGLLLARFSIEVWQPLAGLACSTSGNPLYVYWAFPNVGNTMISDWTIEQAPTEFSISANTQAAGALWGRGPGSAAVPKYIGTALVPTDLEHFLFNVTDVPPPIASCGAALLG